MLPQNAMHNELKHKIGVIFHCNGWIVACDSLSGLQNYD